MTRRSDRIIAVMCLMLYLATASEQPLFESADLNIEAVEPERDSVRRLFSLPFVRFVGAHTGCSCGFPSIRAEEPIQYFDGTFKDAEDREADVKSLRALLELVSAHVASAGEAQLYPVWQGEETKEPKGSLTVEASTLSAERFFFVERFLYQVLANSTSARRD